MAETIASDAKEIIERLAEHRLDWDRIRCRIEAAISRDALDAPPNHHLGPYLTVARQSGAGGTVLAARVGEELGWSVLDGEIVDLMADTFSLDGAMLHLLDEAKSSWVRNVLGELMPDEVVNSDTYVRHLGKVLRLVALHGHVVLVGRGAHCLLPRERGLAVRLVAREEDRVRVVSGRENTDLDAARQHVGDVDRRRDRFIRHYFGRSVDDPLLYDLVLNSSTLSMDELVSVVTNVCRRRGFGPPPER